MDQSENDINNNININVHDDNTLNDNNVEINDNNNEIIANNENNENNANNESEISNNEQISEIEQINNENYQENVQINDNNENNNENNTNEVQENGNNENLQNISQNNENIIEKEEKEEIEIEKHHSNASVIIIQENKNNSIDLIEKKREIDEEVENEEKERKRIEKEKKKEEESNVHVDKNLLLKKQGTKQIVVKTMKELENAISTEQYALQITVSRNLSKGSTTENGKKELVNHMHVIVKLLDGSPDVQQSALEILNNIATIDAAKDNFRLANGFPAIIRLFSSIFEIRTLALNAIGYLITRNAENAKAFYESEGIGPLVQLLICENSRIKFFAAACIWVLASYQNDKYQEGIMEAGGIAHLLSLIKSQHEDIAWQAAGALRNLVIKNLAIHEAILAANGVRKFKKAIELNSTVSDRIILLIVQTFSILSNTESIKENMRKKGVIKVLVERLKLNDNSLEMNARLLSTFSNLFTKNKDNQKQFLDDGGVDCLIDILTSELYEQDVKIIASTTLWSSSLHHQEVLEYIYHNHFDTLKQLLILETEKVLVGVIATFSNFANFSQEYQNVMREKGMIVLLVDFLRCSYVPMLETTAAALSSLMRDNQENVEQVEEWDGALLLSRNLFSTNGGVKQSVTGALRSILSYSPDRVIKAVKEVDALKSIINMLKSSDRVQLQINAAHCLFYLIDHDLNLKVKTMELKAELGIAMCISSKSTRLQSISADLISSLASFDENFRKLLGFEDVVKHLIEIVKKINNNSNNNNNNNNNNNQLLEKVIRAIWAINLNNLSHQQMTRVTGGLTKLIEILLETNLPAIQSVLLKAIASITSKHQKNQEIARLHEGAIKRISSLLQVNEEAADLAENAALAVWCLSVSNSKMQVAFREANGLIPLVELIQHAQANNDPKLIINCTGAISVLIYRSHANKVVFKGAGTVGVLQNESMAAFADNKILTSQVASVIADLR